MTNNLKVVARMEASVLTVAELRVRASALEEEARALRAEATRPETSLADVADLKAAAADLDSAAIHFRRMANRGHRA